MRNKTNDFYSISDDELLLIPDADFFSDYRLGMELFYNNHCTNHREKRIVINLEKISNLDSMMMGMCIEFASICQKNNHDYVFTGFNESNMQLIEATRMKDYFHVCS